MVDYKGRIEGGDIAGTIVISLLVGVVVLFIYGYSTGNMELAECTAGGGGHSCYLHNLQACKQNGGGKACEAYQNSKICLANKGGKSCYKSTDAHRLAVAKCKKYGGGTSCKDYQ